jgi:hypothetical protein
MAIIAQVDGSGTLTRLNSNALAVEENDAAVKGAKTGDPNQAVAKRIGLAAEELTRSLATTTWGNSPAACAV